MSELQKGGLFNMKKIVAIVLINLLLLLQTSSMVLADTAQIKLGNEVLLGKYKHQLSGKRIGIITNQSGVDSKGRSIIDIIDSEKELNLTALFAPEHGIDGKAEAGEYVASYIHPILGIPVNSLYGANRTPTDAMLRNVDILLYDLQDAGARYYTYISTLNYCMIKAQKLGIPIYVLDRPNPVGGVNVEGPVLEETYKTFVGVDILPIAHGMTVGELAKYFNRNIGADLTVIPMLDYTREMIYQDTGLDWVPTSPNIPDIESLFGYMATGLGEGTGIYQADKFKWIGGKGIDSQRYADLLNKAGLQGVKFLPENKGQNGGVRLQITNYHLFNPAKSGIYALSYARILSSFSVPKSGSTMIMFDKIMGTNKIGQYLEKRLTPQQIVNNYTADLNKFKDERKKYLIYNSTPYKDPVMVMVKGKEAPYDSAPYIDNNNRTMVPLRVISEGLGAIVAWDETDRSITVTSNTGTIRMIIGNTKVLVNGEERVMDTNPVIKNSRTMVPLRYVGEFMGAKVSWDGEFYVVNVE
jgi:uncharacterized protein YbbC (DUF1343 family)